MSQGGRKFKNTQTCEVALPSWITSLRAAAMKTVQQEDVEEIIRNQVKRAKDGDKNAIQFVFQQLLGGAYIKGATFVQNNYGLNPIQPEDLGTRALPGSPEKVEVMRERLASGRPATNPNDAGARVD